jgi:hypothetical protein
MIVLKKQQEAEERMASIKKCVKLIMFPAALVPIIVTYTKKMLMKMFTGHYQKWGEWNT